MVNYKPPARTGNQSVYSKLVYLGFSRGNREQASYPSFAVYSQHIWQNKLSTLIKASHDYPSGMNLCISVIYLGSTRLAVVTESFV